MKHPHPFQTTAQQQINAALNASRNPIYCAPTGTGKTFTAIQVIMDRIRLKEIVFVLTPQEEIFDQWVIAATESNIQYGTISDGGIMGRNKQLYICMPLTLANILSKLPAQFCPDTIIIDECFTGNTKVLTSNGYKKINKIKANDFVYTINFDSKDNNIEIKPVLKVNKIKSNENILNIKFSNGKVVKCTENHLFFTQNGWKKAKKLKSVDMVRFIGYNYFRGIKDELYDVRERNIKSNQKPKRWLQAKGKSVLLFSVLKRILQNSFKKYNGRHEQEVCKRTYENKKPYDERRNKKKNERYLKKNRSQTQNTRWKRERVNGSSNFIKKQIGRILGIRISSKNITKKIQWLSKLLQVRYGKPIEKNRDRDRWHFTLFFKKARARQKERSIIEWVGVENCEIQKQGSFRKFIGLFKNNYVYDLTIKDNHNYFANGFLVHNCHHSEADTWQNIFSFFPKAHRLGLTATPKRTDNKTLANTYDMIINGDGEIITVKEAINKNYLSDYLLVVPEEYKLNVPMQNGDFDTEMQAQILGEPRIIGNVIEWYGKIFAGLPVLVACSTHEHAKIMTEQFCAAGWGFDHIHSGLPKAERKRMLREIRTGKLNGLCTVGIGIEGLDIPGLFGLLWLRRTMSVTIYLQFIGRAIRAMEGKKYGIILDFIGNVFIHGLPDAHRTWTLDGVTTEKDTYDAPRMKLCPQCKVMNSEQNTKCHICGYDFVTGELSAGKKRGFPAMEDGRVVLLDDGDLAQRKAEIQEALRKQRDVKKEKEQAEKRLTELNRLDKIRLLKNGFENKQGLFAEAVKKL